MWDKLRRHVSTETVQLHTLLDTHRALLGRCAAPGADPTVDEIPALASILHAFYTGVERIFKRVSLLVDHDPPRGEFWHSDLLERMTQATPTRPAVISAELSGVLQEYLDFWHVFRHAYSFQIQWGKMAHLVLGLESLLDSLDGEITGFLASLDTET